jgi:hypothetical protein
MSFSDCLVQFVANEPAGDAGACVVGPNRSEQRRRLTVDQDDDLVAVPRPLEVLTEPGA